MYQQAQVLTTAIDPAKAPLTLAKLQEPFKKTMESAQKDLKPIYSGLNKYGKALDKVEHASIGSVPGHC